MKNQLEDLCKAVPLIMSHYSVYLSLCKVINALTTIATHHILKLSEVSPFIFFSIFKIALASLVPFPVFPIHWLMVVFSRGHRQRK